MGLCQRRLPVPKGPDESLTRSRCRPARAPMRAAPSWVRHGVRLHRRTAPGTACHHVRPTRRRAPCARRSPRSIGVPRRRPRVTPTLPTPPSSSTLTTSRWGFAPICRRSSGTSSAAPSSPARSPSNAPTPTGAAIRSTSSRSASRRSISSSPPPTGRRRRTRPTSASRSTPSSSSSPAPRSGPTSSSPATPTSPRSSSSSRSTAST